MNQFTNLIHALNPLSVPGGTYSLNARPFRYTVLGAVLVITGVVLKNSLEQLKTPKSTLSSVGMICFVTGWAIIAYSTATATARNGTKTVLSFATSAGIVFAVMQMKKAMSNGGKVPMIYPAIFAGCWLLLGYTLGIGWGSGKGGWNSHTTLGVLAAVMVLVSMMVLLPWQRKKGVIDGPGLPLFVGAWVLIAFANSMK